MLMLATKILFIHFEKEERAFINCHAKNKLLKLCISVTVIVHGVECFLSNANHPTHIILSNNFKHQM